MKIFDNNMKRKRPALFINEAGFTITEVILTVMISGLVLTLVFSFFTGSLQTLTGSQVRSEMQRDTALASQKVQEDVQLAAHTLANSTINDTNAPGGGGIWTAQTANPAVLILETVAVDGANNIIFDPDTFISYKNEVVYFVSGGTLYKRTLANTAATGNAALTSCPPASASSSCPADSAVLKHVTSFTLEHFLPDGSSTLTYEDADATAATFVTSRTNFKDPITMTRRMKAVQRNIQ